MTIILFFTLLLGIRFEIVPEQYHILLKLFSFIFEKIFLKNDNILYRRSSNYAAFLDWFWLFGL